MGRENARAGMHLPPMDRRGLCGGADQVYHRRGGSGDAGYGYPRRAGEVRHRIQQHHPPGDQDHPGSLPGPPGNRGAHTRPHRGRDHGSGADPISERRGGGAVPGVFWPHGPESGYVLPSEDRRDRGVPLL